MIRTVIEEERVLNVDGLYIVTAPFTDAYQKNSLSIGDVVIVVKKINEDVELGSKNVLSKAPLFVVTSDRRFFTWFNLFLYLMPLEEFLEYT